MEAEKLPNIVEQKPSKVENPPFYSGNIGDSDFAPKKLWEYTQVRDLHNEDMFFWVSYFKFKT